jgi:murein L,D-transpeptidase YafK
MMRARKFVVGLAAMAAAIVAALVVWDAAKLDRTIPPLVPADQRASRIVVEKGARKLTLLRPDAALRTYDVSLGSAPTGPKLQEGDGRTPEGRYTIDFKNARSRFHLALRISCPGPQERDAALKRGVAPGGDIMIHGLPRGLGWLGKFHLLRDWTEGCIAVDNRAIEEIWRLVDIGTVIEIRP